MKIVESPLDAKSSTYPGKGLKFALAVSRYNEPITSKLAESCVEALTKNGVREKDITVVSVPGAFELPLTVLRLAAGKKFNAVIALGCIVRGETPHDRYISQATAMGLQNAALETGVPVIFGVLTPLNENQAWARSGRGTLNKGTEAALAALEMANLFKKI